MAERQFGDMIKAVVDVSRGVMAIGGELHADDEAALLDDGSNQRDLWGINLYPGDDDEGWIEFDSMTNVRPSQGNRSRDVEDSSLRESIRSIVDGPGFRVTPATGHTGAAAGRWRDLTLVEQLANVGSEVERAIRAHRAGRESRWASALARALELFDLSAGDPRWSGPARREILRAREEFCRLFFDPDVPAGSAEGLGRYFLHFAVAARNGR